MLTRSFFVGLLLWSLSDTGGIVEEWETGKITHTWRPSGPPVSFRYDFQSR